MLDVSGRTLVLAIQAIDTEIRRLRALAEETTVPGDRMLLDEYEIAAAELESVYVEIARVQPALPPYGQLVNRRD